MARTEPGVDLPRSGAGRVAPHNMQAEESLLGAMLLARDAIAAAAEIARPDHFYKPAHGHIYDAILTLYGSGEPVDPITVGDELARAGLLDTVGGPAALIGLQANAPAISNAGRYAQIIEELALLRRMIGVAGEIAELGYSMPDDVAKAVDSAEAMVYDLAQHRQEGSTAELRQLLEQSLDRLEQLYDRGEAITGTPTGYLDLDELLAGLQPSALVVVGARPAMGKTSFALGMATHAALAAQRPVLFFSLEMSQLEITQRVLCSEARVDATRVRTGKLNEGDWEKIGHTVGRLAEAPIWIDDNPNVTVMEIRSKARKLKSKVGDLGLVVVDYVQLMTGRAMAESRQVEVAEISRGLKILAREIETPVVALAQLNRSLEQRADKRPMLSDLRESGCLPASTRVQRADDGEEVTLGELVLSQEQPLVWSVDGRCGLVPARLTRAFPSGVKPVFRLQLASGRTVDATANHPFLAPHGWVRLDTLERGSVVAVPRRLPPPVDGQGRWADDEVVLLAHLLGAGAMGPSLRYVAADPANRRAVEGAAQRLFGITPAVSAARGTSIHLSFPAPYRLTGGRNHPMRNWLEPLGLWRATAGTAFVPAPVAGLPDHQIALFLRHLWAAGGSVRRKESAPEAAVSLSYPTASRRLALDLQRLLLRLGIGSTVAGPRKQRVGRSGYREEHAVRIVDAPMQGEFLRTVAGQGASAAHPVAAPLLPERRSDDPAPSDLHWDEVTSIIPLGAQPTFDATIKGTHNFIADGVVVHNSLEQDADVVLFLYRDEIYNRESPDQGIAEVIVAKHRSGPTGLVRLAFLGQYTKFVNMARS